MINKDDKFKRASNKQPKTLNRRLKESIMKVRTRLTKAVWGSDKEKYNFVAETSIFFSFWYMQLFRMLAVCALMPIYLAYTYIYVRSVG